MLIDREAFGRRQAEMTAGWYESVKERFGDVDAYIQSRHAAYLGRWKEACRFIEDGARILDIGGGNLFPALMEYIVSRRFDYHYIDVDPGAVEGSRALGTQYGFAKSNFSHGYNDKFSFDDAEFDGVFSSHCIEHSFDLDATFSELKRMLRPEGWLMMAVPVGWEANPEHPYFLDADHWIALTQDRGFDVRTAQVSREYPENGHDLLLLAKSCGQSSLAPRIQPELFRKENYAFLRYDDASITYSEAFSLKLQGDAMHGRGDDWSIVIRVPSSTAKLQLILGKHNWSGIIKVSVDGRDGPSFDLYSWFDQVQPLCIDLAASAENAAPTRTVKITNAGRNVASNSTEVILYGLMLAGNGKAAPVQS